MKYTLLELTQSILSSLNSEQVNSIADNPESLQVAECIKTSYLNMQGRYDLPEHNQLFQLVPSDDPSSPVLMYRPDGVNRIEELRYFDSNPSNASTQIAQFGSYSHDLNVDLQNNASGGANGIPGYQKVMLIPLTDFIDMCSSFNINDSDVGTFTLSTHQLENNSPMNFTFNYKNNKQPSYWTILNNYYIIFDSFDNTQDSTLQASKTQAYGWVIPAWRMEDDFTPNLDEQQFPLLLNEAKSLAFLELKNTAHPKAEKEVMRQLSSLQKFKFTAHRPSAFEELPNFGRGTNRMFWGRG